MKIPTDWTFNRADIADSFDQHVREQLPWYELASGAVTHIARHYIPDKGLVYDIGASTGNIGKLLSDTIACRKARYIGIDSSPDMAGQYSGPSPIQIADARYYDFEPFDVAILFLVVMFIPISDRSRLIQRLKDKCKAGGCIILLDKVNAPSCWLGTVLRRLTIAGKIATNTSPDEIIKKELSLSGVQRPLSSSEIPSDAKIFFCFGEFMGWVIENAVE